MGLDVRLPIGAMFAVIGVLLSIYGLLTGGDRALYERSLFVNVNLWWGVVMFVFGLVMLLFARRGLLAERAQGMHPAADSPEGRRTEARERAEGMEK